MLPSVNPDEYDVELKLLDQDAPDAAWNTEGFNVTMLKKAQYIVECIENNWGERFLFCDVDLIFLGPTKEILLQESDGYDMTTQWTHNSGFFVCAANERTLALWQRAVEHMKHHPECSEELAWYLVYKDWGQDPLGPLMHKDLPEQFLQTAMVEFIDGKRFRDWLTEDHSRTLAWSKDRTAPNEQPNFPFNGLTKDTLVFHAAYAMGPENKDRLLTAVKNRMDLLTLKETCALS